MPEALKVDWETFLIKPFAYKREKAGEIKGKILIVLSKSN